jgi:hypothetical protein
MLEEIVYYSILGLSIDGETAIVALQYAFVPDGFPENGWTFKTSVHVFSRKIDKWIEDQVLESEIGDDIGDFFGYSIAIDGDTIVIGEQWYDWSTGAVDIYVLKDGVWTWQAKLSGKEPYTFGQLVRIRGDRLATATAYFSDGHVEIFKRSGNAWEIEARLSAPTLDPNLQVSGFGYSFAFDDSADRLVVLFFVVDVNQGVGATYAVVFQNNDGVWSQQGQHFAPSQHAGYNVRMSNGTVVLEEFLWYQNVTDGHAGVSTFDYSPSQDQWMETGEGISGVDYVIDMAMEGRRLVLSACKENYSRLATDIYTCRDDDSRQATEIYTRALNGTWQLTEALPGARYPVAVSGDRIAARNIYWNGPAPAACVYSRPHRRQVV